ncbi:hypothetical protein D9757_007214 [Collybiopsis confluens]|uniref:Rad51-like C-terminal domain-containing protein n=1 Tax=Collybiopsis confluens TaxID=2823264 RepID=A0A8H5M403_9AGAR|nr:hypothetical protein D9757_007214 [Collybiopsis confluens]
MAVMLLSTLSTLPNGFAAHLASLGILTDSDLLFSNTSHIEIYTRLPPPKPFSFSEFEALVATLAENLAVPGRAAAELYENENDTDLKMETLPALDNHLGGGLPLARITEISGDRGSGKSVCHSKNIRQPAYLMTWKTLLLNCVLNFLVKNQEIAALWIDTTGDFAVDRAVQILQDLRQTPEQLEATLQRLHVSAATDIESSQALLRALDAQLAHCIVIDSITPLIGPYLSAVSSQGHAIMTALMRYLRHLANRYSMLVLLINNATMMRTPQGQGQETISGPILNPQSAFASTIRKPALGPSFTFMSDATLWLSLWPSPKDSDTHENSTAHTVEVLRSKFSASGVWCTFRIAQTGSLLLENVSRTEIN